MKEINGERILDIAMDRMHSALGAYYGWKWLNQAINVNKAGEAAANENVGVINKYNYFLQQAMLSFFRSFVIDLSIFFDSHGYKDTFSPKQLLLILANRYPESELKDIKERIQEIKQNQNMNIGRLMRLRSYHAAHHAIVPTHEVFDYSAMEELFAAVQQILNLVSEKYNGVHTVWSHVEKRAVADAEYMFENLKRGEAARLEEIRIRYSEKSQ